MRLMFLGLSLSTAPTLALPYTVLHTEDAIVPASDRQPPSVQPPSVQPLSGSKLYFKKGWPPVQVKRMEAALHYIADDPERTNWKIPREFELIEFDGGPLDHSESETPLYNSKPRPGLKFGSFESESIRLGFMGMSLDERDPHFVLVSSSTPKSSKTDEKEISIGGKTDKLQFEPNERVEGEFQVVEKK
ncbi:hypothetical protein C8R42DRAFT_742784 [Lentinula raphanica]|nr:hypothetical protein C8R42DRAFT_742784 [Lentinula raphanica]